MAITFSEAKTETYLKLWQKGATVNFSENVVWDMINQVHRQICEWVVIDIRNPKIIYRAGRLSFMENQKTFDHVKTTALSSQFTWDATTASMPTADFPSAGFLFCEYDIWEYDSKTSNSVNFVTSLGRSSNHKAGAQVMKLHEMPNDFWKPIKLRKASSGREIKYNYQEQYRMSEYYTIETSKDGEKLVRLYANETWVYVMRYMKDIVTMTGDSDVTNLPNQEVDKEILSKIAAWILAYEKWMPVWANLLAQWYANLQAFYAKQSSDEYQIDKTIKVHTFRSLSR